MITPIEVSAPSNIALIKYMGKIKSEGNRPTNSSLSWTMEKFRTTVHIELLDSSQDQWKPLERGDLQKMNLSEKGQARFLNYFSKLKNHFGISGNYLVQSGNNFPSDCGLASSASSFAALTMAAARLAEVAGTQAKEFSVIDLAELSQTGSGSSCRSFFGPFVIWSESGVRPLEFPMNEITHQVIVVNSGVKTVSSSEAHQRVVTSALFEGRPARAEKRLADLMEAFRQQDWGRAFETTWAEFQDMHALFETSQPAFGYFEEKTISALKVLRQFWNEKKDGPLVTMDAGANIHLLYRGDQESLKKELNQLLSPHYQVME
ncbi:MAG: diphosphomevalonate decarboxylase [Proteobacteria bacterium]|nr:diphosphomevalonate decarboxylase [Pseudomonadota bacterium]